MTDKREKGRLLVFILSCPSEAKLTEILGRIPRDVLDQYHCELLMIDDAGDAAPLPIGRSYRAGNSGVPVTVLRNQLNQGYGGSQILGFSYAIRGGFDIVAILHSDGRHAPEDLSRLLPPVADGSADAVLGSRMLGEGAARGGGMPLHRYLVNRGLTRVQNLLLRTQLSDLHSGYRVYAVPMLQRLPFRLNSHDHHFDTQVIIQLLNAGGRIHEVPIETESGDAMQGLDAIRYVKESVVETVRSAVHRANLLYQRRFDTSPGNAHYNLKLGYPSSHSYAIDAVPAGANVMDIGGGPGDIARELANKGCSVCIVDQFVPAHLQPGITMEMRDLDGPEPLNVKGFSHLLLLDIIEHLADPEDFLDRLRSQFTYERQTLILTTPNVAFFVQRLQLLLGQFNYGKAGILDHTHRRLFTYRGLRYLMRDAGFRVKAVRGIPAPFPKVLGNGVLGRGAVAFNLALIRLSRTLFSYQIYVEAEGTPDVSFLLHQAEAPGAPPPVRLRAT